MQTTSATYDRILAGTDCSYEAQLVIDDVGTFGESDLMSISTSIEMFQEDPDIGKAISAEINVVMLNPLQPIPTMATLRPQVKAKGIAPKSSKVTIVDEDLASEYATYSSENITFSSASGATVVSESLTFAVDSTEYLESEWIAQGIFYIDTREVTANNNGLDILTIHGFDAMLKTEQMYSSNETVGDALDISYVQTIADAIGVTADPRTWDIMGSGYMIPFPVGYSMREILGYIASAYAGCFIISDTGQLRLVALEDIEDETRYLIDEIGEIIVFGVDSPEETVTASGAVATFTAGGEYDLDELEIAIDPVQDLHGYDAPYPAGGGTNIINQDGTDTSNGYVHKAYINTSGTVSTAQGSWDVLEYVPVNQSTTYTLSGITANNANGYAQYDANKTIVSYGNVNVNPFTFTTGANTRYVRFNRQYSTDTQVQLNIGSSVITPWSPYENICPISGHTGCEVWDDPKHGGTINWNQLVSQTTFPLAHGENGVTVTWQEDGSVKFSGTASANSWEYIARGAGDDIPTDNHKYLALSSAMPTPQTGVRFGILNGGGGLAYETDNQGYYLFSNSTGIRGLLIRLPSGCSVNFETHFSLFDLTVMFGAGNEPTTYAEFRSLFPDSYYDYDSGTETCVSAVSGDPYRHYSITWQDEAGTVYKGTLNVKTGVLTAISAMFEPPNNTSDFVQGNGNVYIPQATFIPKGYVHPIVMSNDISSHFKTLSATSKTVPSFSISSQGAFAVNGASGITDTVANWKAYLVAQRSVGTPVQFLLTLATPLTFQLTQTQVKTLLDQNNLWANTGNIINLEFTEPASEAVRILV